MRFDRARVVAAVGVLLAFAARDAAAAGPLDQLPAGGQLVAGLTRAGSAKELTDAMKPMQAQLGASMPACVIDVIAKIEDATATLKAVPSPQVTVVVRGAGLRPVLEACLKSVEPGLKIAEEGAATRYDMSGQPVYALWIGKDVLIVGPGQDAKSAAALGTVAAPLARDAAMAPLLAKVDQKSPLWFAADLTGWPDVRKGAGADRAWGDVGAGGGGDLRLTVNAASKQDAEKLVATLQGMVKQLPPNAAQFTQAVTIKAEGQVVTARAPVDKLLALQMGLDPKKGLPRAATTVAILGVVAAVAIPAFMKNARKAKTAEAVVGLRKLFDGAVQYHAANHKLPEGNTQPTPPLGSCCKGGKDTCAPDAKLWAAAPWKALQFSMDDPHHYSYVYQSDGKRFTAGAYGDLDCDGTYSTFEMVGEIGADGQISGQAGMYREKETE